jgi:hypothetical protein
MIDTNPRMNLFQKITDTYYRVSKTNGCEPASEMNQERLSIKEAY